MQISPLLLDALRPKVATRLPVGPTGPLITTPGLPVGGAKVMGLSPLLGGGGPKVATGPFDLSGPKINTGRFPSLNQLSDKPELPMHVLRHPADLGHHPIEYPVLTVAQAEAQLHKALDAETRAHHKALAIRDAYGVHGTHWIDDYLHEYTYRVGDAQEALIRARQAAGIAHAGRLVPSMAPGPTAPEVPKVPKAAKAPMYTVEKETKFHGGGQMVFGHHTSAGEITAGWNLMKDGKRMMQFRTKKAAMAAKAKRETP